MEEKSSGLSYYDEKYYRERTYEDLDPYLKYIILNYVAPRNKTGGKKPRILDVGCGIGVYTRFLKKEGFEAYGVDYSDAAIQISGQIKASAAALPFRDNCFDAVIAMHLIEHLTQKEVRSFLREVYRVLDVSGKVFLLTPNMWNMRQLLTNKDVFIDPTHINMFNPERLKRLLEEENFSGIRVKFKIPLLLQNNADNKWIMPYFGPPWIIRRFPALQDILFFLFTSTRLSYFRDVIYALAKVKKQD